MRPRANIYFVLAMLFAIGSLGIVSASAEEIPFPLLPANHFEGLTLEQLTAAQPFSEHYDDLAASDQRQWVEFQLTQTQDAAAQYILLHERAYLLILLGQPSALQQQCRLHEPLQFDYRYRFNCLNADTYDYDMTVTRWLNLYRDAIAEDAFDIAAQALAMLGWRQAEHGDIAQAFSTYEQALEYVDQVNFFTFNDVLSNTASLYIMYGDEVYIERGIELHHQTKHRLRTRMQDYPEEAKQIAYTLAVVRYNLGITYALHLQDYPTALEWFELVPDQFDQLYLSATVFSALASAYAERPQQAQQWLERSRQLENPGGRSTEYLYCYQQLTEVYLNLSEQAPACLELADTTPLEVKIDIYQRMAQLSPEPIRSAGLALFFQLYNDSLKAQLKQSSSRAASATELSRLQQESRLQSELFAREQQLALAEQQRRDGQIRLAVASSVILLLILILISLRFQQNRKLSAQLASLSVRDSLTGLHNRRFFEQNIGRELSIVQYANQRGQPTQLALFVIDIDYFKQFNDSYGHQVGDSALKVFADRVGTAIRSTDMLIRWGGEEFVMVGRLERNEDYAQIADRILAQVSGSPFNVGTHSEVPMTCTVGGALYPNCGELDWQTLMQLADAALYYGKQQGRNRWVCVEAVLEPEALSEGHTFDFHQAVQQGQLQVRCS